jgi:hypothetical protein
MREVARQAAKAGAVPDDLDRGAVPADRWGDYTAMHIDPGR